MRSAFDAVQLLDLKDRSGFAYGSTRSLLQACLPQAPAPEPSAEQKYLRFLQVLTNTIRWRTMAYLPPMWTGEGDRRFVEGLFREGGKIVQAFQTEGRFDLAAFNRCLELFEESPLFNPLDISAAEMCHYKRPLPHLQAERLENELREFFRNWQPGQCDLIMPVLCGGIEPALCAKAREPEIPVVPIIYSRMRMDLDRPFPIGCYWTGRFKEAIAGKRIAVVDDILATGVTRDAVISYLLQEGAGTVDFHYVSKWRK